MRALVYLLTPGLGKSPQKNFRQVKQMIKFGILWSIGALAFFPAIPLQAAPTLKQISLNPPPSPYGTYAFQSSPFTLVYRGSDSSWVSWDGRLTTTLSVPAEANQVLGVGPGGHVYFSSTTGFPQEALLNQEADVPDAPSLRTCRLLSYDPTSNQTKTLDEVSGANCYLGYGLSMTADGGALYNVYLDDSTVQRTSRIFAKPSGLKIKVESPAGADYRSGNGPSFFVDRDGNAVVLRQSEGAERTLQFTRYSSAGETSDISVTIDVTFKNCALEAVLDGGAYGLQCYRDVDGLSSYRQYVFVPTSKFFEQRDFVLPNNRAVSPAQLTSSSAFDCSLPNRSANYTAGLGALPDGSLLFRVTTQRKGEYFATTSQEEFRQAISEKTNFCLAPKAVTFKTIGQCSRNYTPTGEGYLQGTRRRVRPHSASCALQFTARTKRDAARLQGARVSSSNGAGSRGLFSRNGVATIALPSSNDCNISFTVPSGHRTIRPSTFSITCPTSDDVPSDPIPVSTSVSAHVGIFDHKSKVLREQLLQSGEPFMDNELIAR